ncbi:MAG: ABC transporter substrate-binding protein [Actinomycetota bacterium]
MSHRAIAACVTAVLFLAACSGGAPASRPSTEPTASYPRTVTDDDGVELLLAAPPARIVTFAPSLTEVLFALGIGDRVVGVSGPYDDFPAEAADLPEVGGAGEFGVDPNLETVVALEPDLFLTIAGGDAWKERLRALDVPVFTLDASDLDDLLGDIATVGALTGTEERAAALVASMRAAADAIASEVASRPRVPCFFEVYYPPLVAAGPGTFIDDLLDRAGCDSVSADAAGAYPEWSVEDLVGTGVEVYLVSSESAGDASAVGERPGFDAIDAVAAGRVALIDSDLVTRPGPRIVEGLRALADALHPDPAA